MKSWAVPNGPEPQSGGQAARGAHRGPSDELRHLRGHHPQGRIWRRHGDAVGPGQLDSRIRARIRARRSRRAISTSPSTAQRMKGEWVMFRLKPPARRARRELDAQEGDRRACRQLDGADREISDQHQDRPDRCRRSPRGRRRRSSKGWKTDPDTNRHPGESRDLRTRRLGRRPEAPAFAGVTGRAPRLPRAAEGDPRRPCPGRLRLDPRDEI